MLKERYCRKAFTLIELLVVIAIISLLVSILLPSLKKAQDLAKTVACLSNIRSINTSFALYTAENDGSFPVARTDTYQTDTSKPGAYFWTGTPNDKGRFNVSWMDLIAGDSGPDIFQCQAGGPVPSYEEAHSYVWPDGNFTRAGYGYNVNISRSFFYGSKPPMKIAEVNSSAETFLVMDYNRVFGTYASKAWHFEEWAVKWPEITVAPHPDLKTNFGMVDGHAETLYCLDELVVGDNNYWQGY